MKSKHLAILEWTLIFGAAATLITGCGSSSSSNGGTTNPTPTPTSTSFRQIERLARPAINEGLVVTDSFLNAFNSIPPSADLTTGAAAVVAEAAATIAAVAKLNPSPNVSVSAVAGAFLPDVMRIDTTVASPVGTQAYANSLNSLGSPCAGRKLEDDVMDVTLTVLVGAATTDNVPYAKPTSGPGSTNPAIGHHLLNGQSAPNGAATFPFLADPN